MDISDIRKHGEFAFTISETTEHVWRGTFDNMPESIQAKVITALDGDSNDDDAEVTEFISATIDDDSSLSHFACDRLTSVENQSFSLEEIV